MTKTCSKCKQARPKSEFHQSKKAASGLQGYCRSCNTAQAQAKEWKRLGLTMDETRYQTMLTQQQGKCAICGTDKPGKKRLAVDHDHSSNAVRELLCQNCNTAIGKFDDDPDRMRKAADYITKHRAAGGGPN